MPSPLICVPSRRAFVSVLALLALPVVALAGPEAPDGLRFERSPVQPEGAPAPDAPRVDPKTPVDAEVADAIDASAQAQYGTAGSTWLTFGAGYANDLSDDQDFNLHVGVSRFFADNFEVGAELGGWYFHQVGEDTAGVNLSFLFRYHFLHADDYDWSVYTDVRIGVLVGFDEVPDGGTGFNFTPGAGIGLTKRLSDDARLVVGARWAHISNGRIAGDGRNPSRDSIMGYVGVVVPF